MKLNRRKNRHRGYKETIHELKRKANVKEKKESGARATETT